MPESLNLPRLDYVPKTDEELMRLADEQTLANYVSNVSRLSNSNASNMLRLDKQLLDIEERTRVKIAALVKALSQDVQNVNTKIANAGMLFSTVADRAKAKLQRECDANVEECSISAENQRQALQTEREQIEANYNEALTALDTQRQAQMQAAYNKLLASDRAEQTRVEKYNTALAEKETKYLASRAKAYEAARQAEYSRSFTAKKLYQQMGATGYEESMLWEKYNVFVNHFATFTKREEAFALINGDSYVSAHLKQYFSTLVDWVYRNVPV